METLRRVAVWVAALYWAGVLALHVAVVIGRPAEVPAPFQIVPFFLTMAVAASVVWITVPPRTEGQPRPPGPPREPGPPWYCCVLGVVALGIGMWAMVVGSGVPNSPSALSLFEDTGVASGPPGDRELHSHGRRIRAITEEEYQKVKAWDTIVQTGFLAGFTGMTLAGALYFRHVRRMQSQAMPQSPPATSVSGSS